MKIQSLNHIYQSYKKEFFPKLLNSPNVSPEDKEKISELLKKPWNPYIRRHSALTEKSKILKEHVLRQHAGWSQTSSMHQKYVHYFGNESSESILEAYGLKPKLEEIDKLKPKSCPNCQEPNKIDSKFCSKCRMVLSYDSYTELVQEKEQETFTEKYEKLYEKLDAKIDAIGRQMRENNAIIGMTDEEIEKELLDRREIAKGRLNTHKELLQGILGEK